MNIAIDLGTSFTYVGTWCDNKFVPLIYGDTNINDFGYPTTFQTVPVNGEISDYQCEIKKGIDTVRIECFTAKGIVAIKQKVLESFRSDPDFDFTAPHSAIVRGAYWTNNASVDMGTPEVVFQALFEVLLKLTYKAVQANKNITDKKLSKIKLCFPVIEGGTDYSVCLINAFLNARSKIQWAKHIQKNDISIESENRCVPAIIAEEFLNKKILFIDIGGATSDYCIKSRGKVDDANPNVAQSTLVGTTVIDTQIMTSCVADQEAKKYVDSLMLTQLKVALEKGVGELNIIKDDGNTFQTRIFEKTYNALTVWEKFKKCFGDLLSLARNQKVDLIILSGGGSKISNIKKQAQTVFTDIDVKTIEETALSIGLTDVTANNGVCYGAAKIVDLENRAEGSGTDADDARRTLEILGLTAGVATSNYDVRYMCKQKDEEGFHLFMRAGIRVKTPIYSTCDPFTYGGLRYEDRASDNMEVWRLRVNKLKEVSKFSDSSFLPITNIENNDYKDLALRDNTSGVRINNNTQEYIGVIACQGISAIYFVVATYAGEPITCDGKTYNEGDLINEAWFSSNPLPAEVLHAPLTKAAYDYAKEHSIHPDSADSEYAKVCGAAKKEPQATPSQSISMIPSITYSDKDNARGRLKNNYNIYYGRIKKIHCIRRKKLTKMYNLYYDKIGKCADKSKLESILNEADSEFRRI